MARREVVDCDSCEQKAVASPITVHLAVGDQPCAAGGRSEEVIERLDLCPACAARLLGNAVKKLSYSDAAAWLKAARSTKKGSKP